MIVVDSSVWIAAIRGDDTSAVRTLRHFERNELLIVGDIVLLEVLQGARSRLDAERIERTLRTFRVVSMLGAEAAVRAARNYRHLRTVGYTAAKIADLIIATFCIDNDCALLEQDRDFGRMAPHIGLRLA